MDFIADYLGAFIATWIIFNLFKIILFKWLDPRNLRYISFIGSSILILSITSITMGILIGFVIYMPTLFVWFVLDLIKISKNDKIKTVEG